MDDRYRSGAPGLVGLVLALGAREVGGPLSPAEATLAATADGAEIDQATVAAIGASIARGEDPLGEAFYRLRDAAERRGSGAIFTPGAIIAPMVGWTLAAQPARVVDAGCGSGRFSAAIARQSGSTEILAMDLDPLATLMTRATLAVLGHERATVMQADYIRADIPRIPGRTAYVGNPPYLRHHDLPVTTKAWAQRAASMIGRTASGLAGLHALFFLATAHHGRTGDVGCFVTSAEWLDVNYGRLVRELLLENLGGEAIYVIEPRSQPFGETATTAAIVCFGLGRKPPKLRFRAVPTVDALPDLVGGRAVARERVAAESRWSHFIRDTASIPSGYVELGELCRVHRGAVTGANSTWVKPRADVDLPASVLFSSVTKARELFAAGDRLRSLDGLRVVVDLPEDLDELDVEARRRVVAFLRAAKAAGVKKGYVASYRKAWWRVGLREPAPILATYMARRPPAFVPNDAAARHINIAHGIYPRVELDPGALDRLAQALRATVVLAAGRTYAGGLTKFEPREMERLPVPDLPALTA